MDREDGVDAWREKALELLPELADQLTESTTPSVFWMDVCREFHDAYESPRNDDLIGRIYEYAFWCLQYGERAAQAPFDIPSCVTLCFNESIPTRRASREDMPRWFRRDQVLLLRPIFSRRLDEGAFDELVQLFEPLNPSRREKRQARKKGHAPSERNP